MNGVNITYSNYLSTVHSVKKKFSCLQSNCSYCDYGVEIIRITLVEIPCHFLFTVILNECLYILSLLNPVSHYSGGDWKQCHYLLLPRPSSLSVKGEQAGQRRNRGQQYNPVVICGSISDITWKNMSLYIWLCVNIRCLTIYNQ